jgi:hypothetical protein
VKKRLTNLSEPALMAISNGEPVSFPEIKIQLLPENRLHLIAKADINNGELVLLSMTISISIEKRRRVSFKDAKFQLDEVPDQQRDISQRLGTALVTILDGMVDLDRFDLDGVKMRLNRLETQGEKLIFSGYAEIEHIPQSGY